MIRKRAEHNECEIYTLEELSLHQQDIEEIEHLQNWCKHLQILYLQNNLIQKIERVGKLKKLEYLNLALNNIERVENLEGCESLKKLDLTVNFVGELSSIESLKGNEFLEELYLVGNPCAIFSGYKQYVLATLPQLKKLDGTDIEKSERIKAVQNIDKIRKEIQKQEEEYLVTRKKQIDENKSKENKIEEIDSNDEELTEEEKDNKNKEYWNEKVAYTPEVRMEMQQKMRESKNAKTTSRFTQKVEKRKRRFFNDAGEPLNFNEGKIDFILTESDDDRSFILDVSCYKFLDTSLIDLDVQPKYVRVTIREKILQVVLFEDVKPMESEAKRSLTTGHLLVTLPKQNAPEKPPASPVKSPKTTDVASAKEEKIDNFLEVKDKNSVFDNLANIVSGAKQRLPVKKAVKKKVEETEYDDDHPEVPPLI